MNNSIQDQRVKLYVRGEQKLGNNIGGILRINRDSKLMAYSLWFKAENNLWENKTITNVFSR